MINAITGKPNRTSHLREDVIIDGSLTINNGGQGAGLVLTSDANGFATWQSVSGGSGSTGSTSCSITGGTLSAGTLTLTNCTGGTAVTVTGFTSGSTAGLSTFGYFYQTVADVSGTIASNNGKALFQTAAPANTAGFTMTPASGDITVASAGKYKISFSVAGAEANAFGVFIGASVVTGSIYGSGAGTQQNTGSVIVSLSASDVISLRTVNCPAAITLQLAGTTSTAQIVTAITIEKLA